MALVYSPPSNQGFKGISSLLRRPYDSNHASLRARLDKLSRNEDVQRKLSAPDNYYDLVVCDEAHKLSATFFGGRSSEGIVTSTLSHRVGDGCERKEQEPGQSEEEQRAIISAIARIVEGMNHCDG